MRVAAAAVGGAAMTLIKPALPLAGLCTAMVLTDVVTAWSLSRRVARVHPQAAQRGAGKLQSRRLSRMLVTLGKVYALLLLATAVDLTIVADGTARTARFCAGAVCLWQAISVLENEASCSDAAWARIARRWLIDKARRHLQ